MTGIAAIQTALESTRFLMTAYLGDMSDADLIVRPIPEANHPAWQLGHLIVSEQELIGKELPDASYPALPAGFAEAHAKPRAAEDGPAGFRTAAEYRTLFDQTRSATVAALAPLTDPDLDRPTTGPMAPFAPTLGAVFVLVSNHTLMHGGQFTVTRRKLGKPVAF